MQNIASTLKTAASALVIAGALSATGSAMAEESQDLAAIIAEGKEIAWDRTKGNCLSCHAMDNGEMPGNVGPPLIYMKMRYPNKEDLRKQIYDARVRNPDTMMPPFGAYGALSNDEINKVVEYIYTL